MTETTTRTGTDALHARVEELATAEPAWLAALRRTAWERWSSLPLPSRVEHLWRYTDPERLLPGARTPQAPSAAFGELPSETADGTFENASAYALCRDGVLLRATVDPMVAGAGLLVTDVLDAARRHADLVRPRLLGLTLGASDAGSKFDALSAALFPGGVYVHVPPGADLPLPVRVSVRTGGSALSTSRTLVDVGANARVTIVVDLTSAAETDAPLLHDGAEVYVGAGARVRLVTVQSHSRRTIHAPILRARVERDGRLESIALALGGSLTKAFQATVLAEPGAATTVQGIVFAGGRQAFDHHTFEDHAAAQTTSVLDYRTVVGDHARSAYTGRLRITQAGAGSDARQTNRNLLLSDTAHAEAIPELEILTNDVRCSHAAAVGPIDEEQVFFCQSRGLDRAEARRTIVLGFLEPSVAAVPDERLARRVRDALDERLAGMR